MLMTISLICPLDLQLLNKGEKGDKGYSEAVPWLEAAAFGGFLASIEVRDMASVTYVCQMVEESSPTVGLSITLIRLVEKWIHRCRKHRVHSSSVWACRVRLRSLVSMLSSLEGSIHDWVRLLT